MSPCRAARLGPEPGTTSAQASTVWFPDRPLPAPGRRTVPNRGEARRSPRRVGSPLQRTTRSGSGPLGSPSAAREAGYGVHAGDGGLAALQRERLEPFTDLRDRARASPGSTTPCPLAAANVEADQPLRIRRDDEGARGGPVDPTELQPGRELGRTGRGGGRRSRPGATRAPRRESPRRLERRRPWQAPPSARPRASPASRSVRAESTAMPCTANTTSRRQVAGRRRPGQAHGPRRCRRAPAHRRGRAGARRPSGRGPRAGSVSWCPARWTDERPQTSRSGRTSPIVASTSSASRSGARSSVAASSGGGARRARRTPPRPARRAPNLRSRSPLASRGLDHGPQHDAVGELPPVQAHPFDRRRRLGLVRVDDERARTDPRDRLPHRRRCGERLRGPDPLTRCVPHERVVEPVPLERHARPHRRVGAGREPAGGRRKRDRPPRGPQLGQSREGTLVAEPIEQRHGRRVERDQGEHDVILTIPPPPRSPARARPARPHRGRPSPEHPRRRRRGAGPPARPAPLGRRPRAVRAATRRAGPALGRAPAGLARRCPHGGDARPTSRAHAHLLTPAGPVRDADTGLCPVELQYERRRRAVGRPGAHAARRPPGRPAGKVRRVGPEVDERIRRALERMPTAGDRSRARRRPASPASRSPSRADDPRPGRSAG